MQALIGAWSSLDRPVGEDDRRALYDVISSPQQQQEGELLQKEFHQLVDAAFKKFEKELDEKERFILNRRLKTEEPLTLQDIGDRYGVTREAIRQVESRLLKKLKAFMAKELKDFKDFEFDVTPS